MENIWIIYALIILPWVTALIIILTNKDKNRIFRAKMLWYAFLANIVVIAATVIYSLIV